MIKGVDYYLIDPTVPEIVTAFKYGDIFDDPGNNYLRGHFRLGSGRSGENRRVDERDRCKY